jgi:hypothetical protein
MDQQIIFEFRWGRSHGDDKSEKQPAKAQHQRQDDEAVRKAKLEIRQVACAAKQKRKLERIKERYKTDAEYGAKQIRISSEATTGSIQKTLSIGSSAVITRRHTRRGRGLRGLP